MVLSFNGFRINAYTISAYYKTPTTVDVAHLVVEYGQSSKKHFKMKTQKEVDDVLKTIDMEMVHFMRNRELRPVRFEPSETFVNITFKEIN